MSGTKAIVFALLLMVIGILSAPAQQIRLNASLDTNSILVGDRVAYRLHLLIPDNYRFEWPLFADTLTGHVEILNRSNVDTLHLGSGMIDVSQVFTITSFDTGYYVIPPFKVQYLENEKAMDQMFVESEPFLLNVFSIPVDLNQPIKPIKGPIAVPITFSELLPWILLIFIIAGLVLYFVKRKKKAIPLTIFKPRPKQPSHIRALDELEKLQKEKLWQQGLIKDYYSRLSGIVREYIEERFDIPAIESTTYETILFIRKKPVSAESIKILQELLDLSDLVKFAKAKPLPSEHDHSMNIAFSFVRNTAPAVKEEINHDAMTSESKIEDSDKNDTLNQ